MQWIRKRYETYKKEEQELRKKIKYGNNNIAYTPVQKFDTDVKFIAKQDTEGSDNNQFQDPHTIDVY